MSLSARQSFLGARRGGVVAEVVRLERLLEATRAERGALEAPRRFAGLELMETLSLAQHQ